MQLNLTNIKQKSIDNYPQIFEIYQYLHQHPELSFQEKNTSDYIADILRKYGLTVYNDFSGNAICAFLQPPTSEQKIVLLRADMDALPVEENTGATYCSKNKGIMHACGHDMHMSCILGVASVLKDFELTQNQNICFIFQPGEEKSPGGAIQILNSDILKNYNIIAALAFHIDPSLKTGDIGYCVGKYFASVDEVYLTIKGKGGHAAMPQKINDTVFAAAQTIISLNHAINKRTNPFIPTLLTFGKIIAPGANNVIPEEVTIQGTFRTMDENWRIKAHEIIKETAEATNIPYQTKCEIEIRDGYPFLLNQPELTNDCVTYLKEIFDNNQIIEVQPELIAEDFAYFSQHYPATMLRLGVSDTINENQPTLHSPKLLPNPKALINGIFTLCYLSTRLLSTHS
jgi:amidohydrolase